MRPLLALLLAGCSPLSSYCKPCLDFASRQQALRAAGTSNFANVTQCGDKQRLAWGQEGFSGTAEFFDAAGTLVGAMQWADSVDQNQSYGRTNAKCDPQQIRVIRSPCLAHARAGNLLQAEERAQIELAYGQVAGPAECMAVIRIKEGRPIEARILVERALALAPDNPELHAQLGTLLLGAGDLDAATEQLATARVADPPSGLGVAYVALCSARLKRSQCDPAIAACKTAVVLNAPNSKETLIEATLCR